MSTTDENPAAAIIQAEITRLKIIQPADCSDEKWDRMFKRLERELADAIGQEI